MSPLSHNELTRRRFVAALSLGLLGVSVPSFMSGSEPVRTATVPHKATAKRVIYLYMSGGMSHIDTLDPKPGIAVAGPVSAIDTSTSGIRVSEYLPLLAKQMHHCALVRSLSTTQGAHEQGNYFMHTSYLLRGTIKHPALGAWIENFSGRGNPTLPGNVVISGGSNYPGAGYLDGAFAPLHIGKPSDGLQYSHAPKGVSDSDSQKRLALLNSMNHDFAQLHPVTSVHSRQSAYDQALALMKSADLAAFDISQESREVREAYGDTPFGQGCLLARRLCEKDVRFVEVDLGGWDTHTDNFDRVEDNCRILDRSLTALLTDLDKRGLLADTLVVLTTEFGRSPEIVDNEGRNHHPKAFSGLLAGGGIRGGQVWGSTDERGETVSRAKVEVPDFNATIAYALGLPLDSVVHSSAGRPFTLADKGKPLIELFKV